MPTKQLTSNLSIIIQQGKVLDFIDGKTQRNDTPEEYVRQEIAKSLVREYRYEKGNIEVEFVVRVGSRKPPADLVIFSPAAAHKQENALIIVECKSAKVKAEDKKDGVGQLQLDDASPTIFDGRCSEVKGVMYPALPQLLSCGFTSPTSSSDIKSLNNIYPSSPPYCTIGGNFCDSTSCT